MKKAPSGKKLANAGSRTYISGNPAMERLKICLILACLEFPPPGTKGAFFDIF
jgi:hypothetical protein